MGILTRSPSFTYPCVGRRSARPIELPDPGSGGKRCVRLVGSTGVVARRDDQPLRHATVSAIDDLVYGGR